MLFDVGWVLLFYCFVLVKAWSGVFLGVFAFSHLIYIRFLDFIFILFGTVLFILKRFYVGFLIFFIFIDFK